VIDEPISPTQDLDDAQEFSIDDRGRPSCPICQRGASPVELVSTSTLSEPVASLVSANAPGWRAEQGLCRRCAERFAEAHERLRIRHPGFGHREYKILPTPLRLGATSQYTGRGVTVAFLDSGFYGHPDLVQPTNRILKYVDVTNPKARDEALFTPDVSSWHGMMTSVVACGNGHMSNGLYRGIASDANLVLVKVGTARRIVHDDIRRGIEWVIRNRARYNIRIVNVSCGGDYETSYLDDALSQAAERATKAGILVCAAVGNAGMANDHSVLPPASAPSVLAAGGLDDKNRLVFADYDMYHSSFGPTIDGLQKPEIIAPGIWVAAPILPGTPTADQARLITTLGGAPDGSLRLLMAAHHGVDEDLDAALGLDTYLIRHLVEIKMRDNAVISGSYKHVDGTSFSSPIVASIAAQMLEANPALKPFQVKSILVKTATRLPHVPVDRQGWGVVSPKRAVMRALRTQPFAEPVPVD
jgi:serine protease AprX